MPKISLEIPHSLSVEDACARLGGAVGKLERDYGARCRWDGERRLRVTRKGLDAAITVEDARVRVDMDLGLLMAPLAGRIRSGITRQLTDLLADGPGEETGRAG